MNYQQYILQNQNDLKDRVVCFLKDGNKFLFGEKLDGIGKGMLVGPGGKLEVGESLDEALAREVMEEISVEIIDFEKYATMQYFFPHKPNWSQRVYFYICTEFKGVAQESIELKPKWLGVKDLDYSLFWDDYKYWLEVVLNYKQKLEGSFVYTAQSKVEYVEMQLV